MSDNIVAVTLFDTYESKKLYNFDDNYDQENVAYRFWATDEGDMGDANTTVIISKQSLANYDHQFKEYRIQYNFVDPPDKADKNSKPILREVYNSDPVDSFTARNMQIRYYFYYGFIFSGHDVNEEAVIISTPIVTFLDTITENIEKQEKYGEIENIRYDDSITPAITKSTVFRLHAGSGVMYARFQVYSINREVTYFMDDFRTSKFYANVTGRLVDGVNRNAVNQIRHIIEHELGITSFNYDSYLQAGNFINSGGSAEIPNVGTWLHDYAVDQRINSKQLIE